MQRSGLEYWGGGGRGGAGAGVYAQNNELHLFALNWIYVNSSSTCIWKALEEYNPIQGK